MRQTDFRERPLYWRELAALVLSGWAGTFLSGVAALAVGSDGQLDAQARGLGTLVLLLALLPLLLTLVFGALLQVAAAPHRELRFHMRLSFLAGVIYFLGWVVLVLVSSVTHHVVLGVDAVFAWAYWLFGPILFPPVVALVAERLQRSDA